MNLTSIIWLGSIAVTKVAGIDQDLALVVLGVFALLYQIKGGLKAVALTDIVQVTLLVLGGLIIAWLTLGELGQGAGVFAGFGRLTAAIQDHFHMILKKGDPHYMDLPGLSVLIGGMWIANLSYWGFNQYIIQRALAAKNIAEAQKGVLFAAFLKLLMPLIIVLLTGRTGALDRLSCEREGGARMRRAAHAVHPAVPLRFGRSPDIRRTYGVRSAPQTALARSSDLDSIAVQNLSHRGVDSHPSQADISCGSH